MGLCFYYRGTEIYESWNESLLTSTIDVNRYITHQLSPTSSLVAFCLSTFHLISIPLSKETIPSFKSPATRLYNPVCRLVRQSVSLSVFRFIGPLEPIRCDLKSSSFFYHRPARYPALFCFLRSDIRVSMQGQIHGQHQSRAIEQGPECSKLIHRLNRPRQQTSKHTDGGTD